MCINISALDSSHLLKVRSGAHLLMYILLTSPKMVVSQCWASSVLSPSFGGSRYPETQGEVSWGFNWCQNNLGLSWVSKGPLFPFSTWILQLRKACYLSSIQSLQQRLFENAKRHIYFPGAWVWGTMLKRGWGGMPKKPPVISVLTTASL